MEAEQSTQKRKHVTMSDKEASTSSNSKMIDQNLNKTPVCKRKRPNYIEDSINNVSVLDDLSFESVAEVDTNNGESPSKSKQTSVKRSVIILFTFSKLNFIIFKGFGSRKKHSKEKTCYNE